MGRLRDWMAGARRIKRISFPLANASVADDFRPPGSIPGASVVCSADVGLMVLTGTEDTAVLAKAREYAKAHGGNPADANDPILQLGVQVYTLAIACVDPDSDPKNPVPFFGELGDTSLESAAKEILSSTHLSSDTIVFLYKSHELWQSMCSPLARQVSIEELTTIARQSIEEDDPRGFLALEPGTRWSCFRFMAQLWLGSLKDKSPSTQLSEKPEPSTTDVGSA